MTLDAQLDCPNEDAALATSNQEGGYSRIVSSVQVPAP